MKEERFDSYANILITCICLFPFLIGMLLGIFFVSPLDAKYLTVLIGAFAGILAFAGVVYSKEKERLLKEKELLYNKNKDQKELMLEKTEEILDFLSKTTYIASLDKHISEHDDSIKQNYLVQINQIEFISLSYEIGSLDSLKIMQAYFSGETSKNDFLDACTEFRRSVINQTKNLTLHM